MKKTIWILNHYAGNNEVGLEYRHFLIAKELKKQGYNVIIIAASYTHLLNKPLDLNNDFEYRKYDGIDYIWIKTSFYEGNGISRFKNMFLYSLKLQNLYKKFNICKPDYVLASSPHPFVIINGFYISKYFKAKFIFEERDLWPMSIIELTSVSKYNPLVFIMQWLEDFAYKKADLIVSPLVNLKDNIVKRGINNYNFLFFPNGILIEDIDKLLSIKTNVDTSIFKHKLSVGFAGTVGASNCVDMLVYAAKELKNHDIGFVIIGDGEFYNKLLDFSKQNNLKNVYLLGKKSKSETLQILQYCDVLYNAAPDKNLYKYGLSAIKLPEYMYLGKYIINAVNIKNDLVELANCGSTILPNQNELASEMRKIFELSKKDLIDIGKKGKEYVINNLTYEKLVTNFINSLEKL